MELLQQAAAAVHSHRDTRPFGERFQQLAGLLQVPLPDLIAARGAAELSAMLDDPGTPERRPGSPAARLMAREVDRLGERLRPLGRALLPALESAQRGNGRQRSFEVAVALLHQLQAALSLLTMSCSFIFEGTIPATPAALRGIADGYAAMLPALLPLLQAVRQRCQVSRDGRLLGGVVMHNCDVLRRTVGCFQAVGGGEQWPLFEAALPVEIALPWVRELVTWAELAGPHHFDLAPTLAMLGRLLLVHRPLQAALQQELPLQRDLLRQLLKVAVPAAGAPETLTWVGDVEDATQILCCPGMEPALQEHGRRGLQAALNGLHTTLCLMWQLRQLHGEATAHGTRLAQLVSITRGAAVGMYPLALSLTVAIDQASEEAAANSGGLSAVEQLRMVWQAHAAFCCVLHSMPDQTIPQQSQLVSYCNLLATLLGASINLAEQCPGDNQADAQRLLDSMLLAHLALAKHWQQRPGATSDSVLRLLLLEPYMTSQPELRAAFEAGGGLALYLQVIQTICQDPPTTAAAELAMVLEGQLRPPHADQAVAAELVTSGLHHVLAAGGRAADAEEPAAAELAGALRELARKAVMVLGQAGSELCETAAAPSIEEPFLALDGVIQGSLEGSHFTLTPVALEAAEPLAQALQQLWEQQRQAPEQQAETRLRMAWAAGLRSCANLACPNQVTGGPLKTKRCAGCKAVRYCCTACQTEDWRVGGHRHACKLLQAKGSGA